MIGMTRIMNKVALFYNSVRVTYIALLVIPTVAGFAKTPGNGVDVSVFVGCGVGVFVIVGVSVIVGDSVTVGVIVAIGVLEASGVFVPGEPG